MRYIKPLCGISWREVAMKNFNLALLALLFSFLAHVSYDNGQFRLSKSVLPELVKNDNPFSAVLMPEGAKQNEVIIFAPLNCSSREAKMAERLEKELNAAGVPARRINNFSLSVGNMTQDQRVAVEETGNFLNASKPPVVLINGFGKSQPTTEEIVAMYKNSRR